MRDVPGTARTINNDFTDCRNEDCSEMITITDINAEDAPND